MKGTREFKLTLFRENKFFPHRLVIEPEREPGDGHCHGAGDVDLKWDFISVFLCGFRNFLSNNSVLLKV